MKKSISVIKVLSTLGLVLAAGAAGAQSWKINCTNTGASAPEPLGDREKHSLMVKLATCIEVGGPMDGAVVTQGVIWEHDAAGSKALSGDSVARKPGATAAYRVTEGTLAWVMREGKIAGWTAAGKAMYTLAVGTGAQYAGKSFSWKSWPTGPNTYVTEMTLD